MAAHASYIHAVADHLDKAGFFTLSVRWDPRSGHIELGCQDGWDHYDRGDATLTWDEQAGWRIRWGGITTDLTLPRVASPDSVAAAVGWHLGVEPGHVTGAEEIADVRAKPGTPEFEAALAAYDAMKESA